MDAERLGRSIGLLKVALAPPGPSVLPPVGQVPRVLHPAVGQAALTKLRMQKMPVGAAAVEQLNLNKTMQQAQQAQQAEQNPIKISAPQSPMQIGKQAAMQTKLAGFFLPLMLGGAGAWLANRFAPQIGQAAKHLSAPFRTWWEQAKARRMRAPTPTFDASRYDSPFMRGRLMDADIMGQSALANRMSREAMQMGT